ncbi:cell envelope-related function transcriptional attenuator common domain-containing protein [Nocardioides scoriae]|uniref:Cell envelope-related function transcriptional attenuator common domain-containing protein n=1 Tax=Nocardioides scoriae TaxID=642780 RepID=A0A1H1QZ60_9ACTN|nr:LCP family protein [Nocardioides scoriae]SDS28690.1 cell envelope-related function transcriptional attenuator common domain-containing protein [Nocardioides scoriae]
MPATGNGRGRGPGDPGEDDSQYSWLYGGQDRRPGADDPEPTRMLPRLDRRTGRPVGEQPTQDGLGRPRQEPPPPATSRQQQPPPPVVPRPAPAARRPRRRRPVGRILALVVLAWLVFLVAVPIWAVGRIDKVDITPAGERPAEQPGTTYLLVGSDSRKGLSPAENKRLGTGGVGEDIGQRTDTIMLLHTGSGPSMLLSIPRDSLVEVPGRGRTKINSAFAAGGPKLLVQTIEQNTGVRVDDYVEIGFGGFVNAVDAVGGITVCPRERMVDPKANLRISKGCQEVDGVKALGYSRSRYVSALGDLDRARRQREVVSAIGAEVKSPWTFINPWRYFRVNQAATSSLRISEGTGPVALAKFGLAMTRVNGTTGLTCGMPIADQEVNWDSERALALLAYVKQDRTGDIPKRLCTPTGLPGTN